ncbi:MAG TPA: hypothetical protein QF753_13445 [Victivallales bacterium]|nr:hypothetical protein [Victivallales bacterium]
MKNSSLTLYIISSLIVIFEGVGLFFLFRSLSYLAYGILSGGFLILIGAALFIFAMIVKSRNSRGSKNALLIFSGMVIYLGGMISAILVMLAQMINCGEGDDNRILKGGALIPLFAGILLLISLILILLQPLLHLISSVEMRNIFSNLDVKFIMPFLFFSMVLSYAAFIKKGEKKIVALLFLFLLIIITKQFKDTFFINYLISALFAVHGFSRELISSIQVMGALFFIQNFILLIFIGTCIISKSKNTYSFLFLTSGIFVILTAVVPTVMQFAVSFLNFDSDKTLVGVAGYIGNIPFIILFILLCIKLFKRKSSELYD